MMNSGTLVDRRLEAGHGDKVAIRCAGEEVTYAQLHGRICAAGTLPASSASAARTAC